MKFGVVIFPGSNCDRDMIDALHYDMKQEVVVLWHKDDALDSFNKEDCVILPGGFSYGDYLRCGAIARFSPMMQAVIKFAKEGGKVLGICNGFQMLCESGLLPGVLLQNNNQQFICKNTYLTADCKKTLLTRGLGDRILKIPIAHGEGRYFANAETLADIEANKQVVFRYCNKEGKEEGVFNPNGSVNNIAGICNKERNVFGMMPHPERATNQTLGNDDGLTILEGLLGEVTEWA